MTDAGAWTIRFHYYPAASITVALPYIIKPDELSDDDDTPLLPISNLLEIGAQADAYRYKNQFAKAQIFEALFSKELAEYIWEQENQPNQVIQFNPVTYDKDNLY
jgi:hypothetical protein